MKNLFIALVAGMISSMALLTDAFAQSANLAKASSPKIFTNNIEGITDPTAAESITTDVNKGDLAGINEKAIRNFEKAYRFVNNESWSVTKDGFAANFMNDGVRSTIFYNNKGRWVGSVKGYNAKLVSKKIGDLINSNFDGYTINYVQEIETTDTYNDPTFLVHIESNKKIKQVRVWKDTFDVYKEYDKAPAE